MLSNYLPYLVLWGLLAASVVALIIWRKAVASEEDDSLHVLDGEVASVSHQTALAQKLEQIDRWGKLLTIVTVVFGLVIAGLYLYQMWVATSTTIQGA